LNNLIHKAMNDQAKNNQTNETEVIVDELLEKFIQMKNKGKKE